MFFQTGDTRYNCIGEKKNGRKMDIYICESDKDMKKYYVWAITDNVLAKRLIKAFISDECNYSITNFMVGNINCMVLPFAEDRNILEFGFLYNEEQRNDLELFKKIVFQCMTSGLPWEVLYAIINENKINITEAGEVYFTYDIIFTDIESKCESDIVNLLGDYLEKMMEKSTYKNWSSYRVIYMKNKRQNYRTLSELYQDINNNITLDAIDTLRGRITRAYRNHKERISHVVKICCVVIGIVALIVFLSNTVFDVSPLYRLFVNTFKKIGTESMLN